MSAEFYVGYQKEMPDGMARFLRRRVALILAGVVVLATGLAASQRPFGKGRFEFGTVRTFEGLVNVHPYPTLLLAKPDGVLSRFLLVAPGKFGATPLLEAWNGRRVKLAGTLIERDGRSMLEVVPDSVSSSDTSTASVDERLIGPFTLRGEIVDSKCYLGVMKPGNLKPHKSCAIRCISGGIPPVLLVRDAEGNAQYFVLTGSNGEPVNDFVIPYVAEPIEVSGDVIRSDDLYVLKINPATVKRLE